MNQIRLINTTAYEHLMERQPKTWCMAYFEEDGCYNIVKNDNSKSFNATLVIAMKKPILAILAEITIFVMDRMYH